ncbi:TonB-dependent receptor [Oxalobacteraceae bacterium OM1]|nr:TonB-dependent receptor [Oxalobacteraceae bacterium OM1]
MKLRPLRKRLRSPGKLGWVLAPLLLAAPGAHAVVANREYADLSLEELANIQITSVSRRSESLAEAPASVFVITGEEIRRSGATTLPEALRLAPNLQISRVDARNYAVTARGFSNPFENKLLVMIDGRTVYSPLFSGVFWDVQDVVLEDVERIEVVSGPGGSTWGVNAVNGVINVITRSAADTQGTLVEAGRSRNERQAEARYGGVLAGGHYRVYGKFAGNDDSTRANGTSLADGWQRTQAGFRADWGDSGDNLTALGNAYRGYLHQAGTADIRVAGANLLGRVTRQLSDDADLRLQAYIDHTERDQPGAYIEYLNTIDLDVQHTRKQGDHTLTVGGGYRIGLDRLDSRPGFAFLPLSKNLYWANLFAQDDIALRDDLKLTAGLRLEDNNYTGLEALPTLRLAWKPAANRLAWAALSRAVRAPSRIDRDFFSPTNPRVVNGVPQYAIAGGPDFRSEIANVLEAGWRAQPSAAFSYSATAYYSRFTRLRTLEPNPNGPGSVFSNQAEGSNRGVELWGTWQAAPSWRLSGGAVVQRVSVNLLPGSRDAAGNSGLANNDPSQFWLLRSSYDLSAGKEVDLSLRHTGSLPQPVVPGYTTLDARFGWKIRPDLELSLIGQNLLDSSHPEFGAAAGRPEFERSVFVKLVWRN